MSNYDWNRNLSNQQPPWVSASTAETQTRVNDFVRSVYLWMFGGLIVTALAALWVVASPMMQALLFSNRMTFFVFAIAELGIVFFLSARARTLSSGAAALAFMVFSGLNGLTLSSILFVYTRASVLEAFVISAGMFGAMALYGLVTKRDLTSWGSFFMMGLFGILILIVASFFIHSSALEMAIATIGIFVFVGLTAYDNQKIKAMATVGGGTLAVIGALTLYLDFINLFLFVLRLLGAGERRR
jgi:FtsH-binding integral membrane protein